MRMAKRYDFLILGSGSTAFAAALRAVELGKTVVMTESRIVGGTCANRGCLPSKNLIEAARIVYEAAHPRYPGLTPAKIAVDFRRLVQQKNDIVREYRRKKYESLVGGRIRIEKGRARFIDSHTVAINDHRLTGEKVLIATGSRPIVPPIAGLDQVPYLTSDLLTSDEPMELTELPRSFVIVGGGYIALELGQMFRRFGSEVTILERDGQLLAHGYEPELGPVMQAIFASEGIHVVTGASPLCARRDGDRVIISASVVGVEREFSAERLLLATGRRPNSDQIDIERAGVQTGPNGEVKVDKYLRTNVPHIFAAGDVIGRETDSQMATPVGSHDGGIAAHNALSSQPARPVNHGVIPRAIFTDPQVAMVGFTEQQAVEAGHLCWCNTVPMSLVPRAGAIRDTRGIIKMVADDGTEEVLGVSMVGSNAGEVIHEAAMGLRFHARIQDFIDLLHVYPTIAEALKIAAISRYKDPAKLSCCAE
jgi:mercuric reductase